MDVAEPFAETPQPCGERRLVKRRLFAITFFACVVGHAFDTRDGPGRSRYFRRPKAARTILTGSIRVKNRRACGKLLGINIKFHLRGGLDRLVLVGSERGGTRLPTSAANAPCDFFVDYGEVIFLRQPASVRTVACSLATAARTFGGSDAGDDS
jgi:hypothetical protein